jgi:hypothetical protein
MWLAWLLSGFLAAIAVYFFTSSQKKKRGFGKLKSDRMNATPELTRFRNEILASRKGDGDSKSTPMSKPIHFPK